MKNLFYTLFIIGFIVSCGTENKPTYKVTTTVSPTEGGTITLSPSGGVYSEDEVVTMTGTPSNGWRFVRWEGDWSSNQNPSTLIMTKDYSVVGVFEKRNYPLTITIEGNGEVEERVIQQKTTEYPFQTVVELTPVPDEGWKFVEWSGDLSGNDVPKQITVDGEKTVTAKFERKNYPLTINIVGEGTVKETVLPQKTTEYPYQTVVILESIPSEGWEFVSWSGDLSGNENPQMIVVDEDKSVTVTFQLKTYPLIVSVVGNGTVGVDPLLDVYPHGSQVTLTPIPYEGWKLESWGGDVSGTTNPLVITVSKEMNVTVTFTRIAYLNENGITIMCPNGKVGEIGVVDGVQYEVVDRNRLIQRRDEGKDLTKVCTSLVTDMGGLFQDRVFNQPIGSWDVSSVRNMGGLFWNTTFNQVIDKWDVRNVSSMTYMFAGTPFNQSIGDWNTTGLLNARGMFQGSLFNQPIEDWNVGNVRNMFAMFAGTPFNQLISDWDVGNVSDMEQMFSDTPFNQPIGKWDVRNVTNMRYMFNKSNFNKPIGDWDVSSVRDMSHIFNETPFNQPIGDWNVGNVTDMRIMFRSSPFNQPIGDWNVSNVTNMSGMFDRTSFNQTIGDWDVSNVRNMSGMFHISSFNQPIGNWNVGKVTDMFQMFHNSPFNQPIVNWNVSNVMNMKQMFHNTPFNQIIEDWNVSNVINLSQMFQSSSFNQNISKWCVTNIITEPLDFSSNSPLTSQNKPIWGTCPQR